jgi:hypothetical protein
MSHFTGTIYANDAIYAGTDMGASIANALTADYARGGGSVSAAGFICPTNCQIDATLTVGDGTHSVTLIWPHGVITRATGAQILYKSHVAIVGQGQGDTKVEGPSDVTAVQQSANAGNGISDVHFRNWSIQDTGTVTAGSIAFMAGGPNQDASRGEDVFGSLFENMNSSGASIGLLMNSQHGCICYNKFHNVNPTGAQFGIKEVNNSGYGFGYNSNEWYEGNVGGPIGLYAEGGVRNLWVQPDFENNTSATGAVIAAQVSGVGSAYTVGDVVTPTAGCTTNPTLTVNYVTSGAVGAQGHEPFTITTPGAGCPTSVTGIATTGGTGTGLTVDLQTSGYMVLVGDGNLVMNQYEEAGATDFICGQGNVVYGAFFSSNGAGYAPNYCAQPPGVDTRYHDVDSNVVGGSGAVPRAISTTKGIVFGASYNPGGTYSKPNLSGGSGAKSGACDSHSAYIDVDTGLIQHCSGGIWTNP